MRHVQRLYAEFWITGTADVQCRLGRVPMPASNEKTAVVLGQYGRRPAWVGGQVPKEWQSEGSGARAIRAQACWGAARGKAAEEALRYNLL